MSGQGTEGDGSRKRAASFRAQFLLTGGFPELLLALPEELRPQQLTRSGDTQLGARTRGILLKSQRVLRADAVERAIYKDIPQTFGVDNPMWLERLLYALDQLLVAVGAQVEARQGARMEE